MRKQDGAMAEMPKYQSHKKVWALKIKSIEADIVRADRENRETDGGVFLKFEDESFAEIKLDRAYANKHNPKAGGYYVVYEDGYKSWSPAEAFEAGYRRL